mgnify:CR=1 FL=1
MEHLLEILHNVWYGPDIEGLIKAEPIITAGLIMGGASILGGLFGASGKRKRARRAAAEKARLELVEIDKRVVALETEVHIQFKDLYNRIKRIEAWAIGSVTSIILLLLAILYRRFLSISVRKRASSALPL